MAQTYATGTYLLPADIYFSVGKKIWLIQCDGTMLILISNFDLSVKILWRPLYQKS
jgi:hypothetical protein